jgi:ribosomal protein S18 acetylase RimI-like enzyme
MDEVKVIEWEDRYSGDFVSLSVEWLEKYLSVEPYDLEILHNPHAVVLDRGGNIFFAECNGRIVGTVAMIKCAADTFELAKLAVTEEFKGRKIGIRLMEKCMQYAKENGAKKVMLYTNQKLTPAIGLYKKYGFREVPLDNSKYLESDIKMELIL